MTPSKAGKRVTQKSAKGVSRDRPPAVFLQVNR